MTNDDQPSEIRGRSRDGKDGLHEKLSTHRPHEQQLTTYYNPFCERIIGSLKRECTDHIIPLGEQHLKRILRDYIDSYYNTKRCHLSLDGDAPIHRPTESVGDIVTTPVLGGLHHCYHRAA